MANLIGLVKATLATSILLLTVAIGNLTTRFGVSDMALMVEEEASQRDLAPRQTMMPLSTIL